MILSNLKNHLNAPKGNKVFLASILLVTFWAFGVTIFNGYNLDDNLVTKNHPVTSLGLDGLKRVYFESYYSDTLGYEYGFRPTVLASFAIEHELFGESPHIGHAVNVFIYLITVAFIFLLVAQIFPNQILITKVTTVIFALHPIHTEVVASLKNRDELLSFFFLLAGTLAFSKLKNQWVGALVFIIFFFLGITAKLSALPLLLCIFFLPIPGKTIVNSFVSITCAGIFYWVQLMREANHSTAIENSFLLLAACAFFIAINQFEPISDFLNRFLLKINRLISIPKLTINKWIAATNPWEVLTAFLIMLSAIHNYSGTSIYISLILLLIYLIPGNGKNLVFGLIPLSLVNLAGIFNDADSTSLVSLSFLFASFGIHFLELIRSKSFNWLYFFSQLVIISLLLTTMFFTGFSSSTNIMIVVFQVTLLVHYATCRLINLNPIKAALVWVIAIVVVLCLNALFDFNSRYVLYLPVLSLVISISIAQIPERTTFQIKSYLKPTIKTVGNWSKVLTIISALIIVVSILSNHRSCIEIADTLRFDAILALERINESMFNHERNTNIAYNEFGYTEDFPVNYMRNSSTARPVDFVEHPLSPSANVNLKLGTSLMTLLRYNKLLFYPFPLAYYYGFNEISIKPLFFSFQSILSLCLHILYLIIAVRFWKSWKGLSIGILLYMACIVLFSGLAEPVVGMFAERLAYSASFGFSLVIGVLISRLFSESRNKLLIPLSKSALGIITLCTIGYTFHRNRLWKSDLTLMNNDITYIDQSANAHRLLADATLANSIRNNSNNISAEAISKSIYHYSKAVEIYPGFFNAHVDLAKCYMMSGNPSLAIQSLNRALKINPDYYEIYFNLASCHFQIGNYLDAKSNIQLYLRQNPDSPEALNYSAMILFKIGDYQNAIDRCMRVIQISPESPTGYDNLAKIHSFLGNSEESAKWKQIAEHKTNLQLTNISPKQSTLLEN